MTIKKSAGGGYQVKSESGKNLSKSGLSKAAAEKRLQQVEYFKHHEDIVDHVLGKKRNGVKR